MTIWIDVSEVQRWGGLLGEEIVAIGQRVEAEVASTTALVRAGATRDAPVLTGQLRSTIRSTGKGTRRAVRAGTAKVFWTRFQEFGTRKMRANPFLLTQADEAAQHAFATRIEAAVNHGRIYT